MERSLSPIDTAFSDGGALARALPGYEPRPGQRRMAQAVASIIDEGGTLLAEAGTGTGKTLAYLVPAILSGQRLVVSTGTKNLQEQIFNKDLPALRAALSRPFTATLMKGRSNYLCLHRWELYRHGAEGHGTGRLIERGDRLMLPVVEEWLERTTTGDRAELTDLPDDLPFWNEVAAEAGSCLGADCPRYADCFITRMRQRAAEADVVIVNHHLLCADASVRQSAYGEVIPSCPTLVVDEAHQLEEVATQYFGISVSTFRVEELVRDGERVPGAQSAAVSGALARVADAGRAFFDELRGALTSFQPPAGGPRRTATGDVRIRYTAESLTGPMDRGMELVGALDRLETLLAPGTASPASPGREGAAPEPADAVADTAAGAPPDDQATATLRRRAGELRQDLRHLLRAGDPDCVYFVEARGRGFFMRAAPINVSAIVREAILDRFRSVLLTSATLAVDRSFDYARRRLGARHAQELRVPSEFDYATQALLYLPRRMPPPNAPAFAPAAAREAIQILTRSRGRAFVLFTSHAGLRASEPLLRMALPYPLFVQGTAQRSLLVEQFRRTPNAVLLGTSSFWQGVDVVGEALSCVIIDRLPFASPGDPVTAARIDAVRTAGGDAFADYQVPLAILSLLQGLGRLIRHRGDRGVLAILDPRLQTMGYGRRFLASLPPAPVTHDLDTVERFFK